MSSRRRSLHLSAALSLGLLLGSAVFAAGTTPKVDFNRDVRPLLQAKCVACHGPNQAQGGLRLHAGADALRGGDSGAAIQPGHADQSLLLRLVSGADPKRVMPPSGPRLTATQVRLLRDWINQGAPWPSSGKPEPGVSANTVKHWAFQPITRPKPPQVRNRARVRNPVDAFVLARLEKEKIAPSPEADRPTLIRRLSLDLLGLPPTPAEVDAFVNDRSPDAYEKLVDRLLASPHFGERWGRHWLDLARYADSDGYEKDLPRPYAYLYRDWVIDAINRDMPFDQFTTLQLAGDLLAEGGAPVDPLEARIATGFHRNTLKNREGGVDEEEDRVKITVDRANTTGTVWLGLTVGCAQCHSHKYDPITQREYYGLYAFFNTVQEVDLPCPTPEETAAYRKAKAAYDQEHARLTEALARYEREVFPRRLADWAGAPADARQSLPAPVAGALAVPAEQRTPEQQSALEQYFRGVDPELLKLQKAVADHAKKAPAPPDRKAQTLAENPKPPATRVLIRGDFLRPGDPVQPHVPAVLPALATSSGRTPTRLDLARWIVDPRNPLTARVAVNRAWQHLFGQGLVTTPDDFGVRGAPPTHPELLDWLASWFSRSAASPEDRGEKSPLSQSSEDTSYERGAGWSLKRLIRLIVTSATYRQSSRARPDLEDRDPRNELLARQNRFRVEAEIVRDLYLAASGLLHPKIGGPSIRPPLPGDIAALGYAGTVKWTETTGPDRYRRGMYIFFQRTVPYPQLVEFDAPDGNNACTRRERSNTPLQALTLLNDPVFVECARALGLRLLREPAGVPERARLAFRTCLSREPTAEEAQRLVRLYEEVLPLCKADPAGAAKLAGTALPPGADSAEAAAWITVARTLLNLDEFITRE
jgi:mono/diheme cytochrome c family protein